MARQSLAYVAPVAGRATQAVVEDYGRTPLPYTLDAQAMPAYIHQPFPCASR